MLKKIDVIDFIMFMVKIYLTINVNFLLKFNLFKIQADSHIIFKSYQN